MPRHNYHKIAPYVKSIGQKYNVPYISKPLSTAMGDIYRYDLKIIFLLNNFNNIKLIEN